MSLGKLFQLETTGPVLMLAPMVDLAGWAFREMIRQAGGCHIFYSEMLNARRIPKENAASPIFYGFDQEKNLLLQLLGNDAALLSSSIQHLETLFNPLGYDLNMGCSRAAIMRHGWGAAMLNQLVPTAKVLAMMRKQTSKPLTVKIRIAWDCWKDADAFLKMLEGEGIDAVIVHARTPEKIFTRPAKWEWIREAKVRLTIPVVGNGDIFSVNNARQMIEQTDCDGLMIGRGAVADPDIFNRIQDRNPFFASKQDIFKMFVDLLGSDEKNPKKMSELRAFCQYFSEGMPVPHWFWGKLQGYRDFKTIVRSATEILQKYNL